MISITVNTKDNIQKDRDILDVLPHGSGIDADWRVSFNNNQTKATFRNSFHCMDESGFYEGWQDFQIVVNLTDSVRNWAHTFKLQFTGDRWLAKKHDLRPYLEDMFAYAFDEIKCATLHSEL